MAATGVTCKLPAFEFWLVIYCFEDLYVGSKGLSGAECSKFDKATILLDSSVNWAFSAFLTSC